VLLFFGWPILEENLGGRCSLRTAIHDFFRAADKLGVIIATLLNLGVMSLPAFEKGKTDERIFFYP
jgi:hypothetical protein